MSSWTSSCSIGRPARILPDKVLTQTTQSKGGLRKRRGIGVTTFPWVFLKKVLTSIFFLKSKDWPEADGTVVKAAVKRRETGPVFPKAILIWNKNSPQNASEVWHSHLALGLWCLGSVAERCVVLCYCWWCHLLKGTSLSSYYKANILLYSLQSKRRGRGWICVALAVGSKCC